MTPTTFIALITIFTVSSLVNADVTVNIAGSSSFRQTVLTSIHDGYEGSGMPFKFAYDEPYSGYYSFANATHAIFQGKFLGVAGITTIRCCFTGSLEGIRALIPMTNPSPPRYYETKVLDGIAARVGGEGLANQSTFFPFYGTSHIAFSDVSKAKTPYASLPLQPWNPEAGVIVFTMLTNEGSTVTNVTTQQFRALLTGGYQPLSLFTGNTADTTNVFATGRNDGSGTRSFCQAETGYGVVTAVKQYVTNVSTPTTLTTIQLVPAGGLNSPALPGQSSTNASTVWGQDIDGNGGYNSSSRLRADMGKTGAAVTVLDELGGDSFGAPVRADLVTCVSVNDAVTARNNGAVLCGYNGVRLDGIAASGTALTAADKAKVTEGSYTAWSYEQMYRRNDITSGDIVMVYNVIKSRIPSNLGAAGIPLTDMKVGRPFDGGVVTP